MRSPTRQRNAGRATAARREPIAATGGQEAVVCTARSIFPIVDARHPTALAQDASFGLVRSF